ncbi:hypothetical protein ON010_g17993 [Phytophthora cinnamomi]|nr:hypothetical protein ON010_g17993 [Phytophthora cinnamomi]
MSPDEGPICADVGERDVGGDGEQRREANAHVDRGHGDDGRHRSGPGAVGGAKRTLLLTKSGTVSRTRGLQMAPEG